MGILACPMIFMLKLWYFLMFPIEILPLPIVLLLCWLCLAMLSTPSLLPAWWGRICPPRLPPLEILELPIDFRWRSLAFPLLSFWKAVMSYCFHIEILTFPITLLLCWLCLAMHSTTSLLPIWWGWVCLLLLLPTEIHCCPIVVLWDSHLLS